MDADALAADAGTEIAAAVWDRDATLSQTQGTFGQAVGDPVLDTDTIYALANTIQADTDDIQTRLPAALVSGRMDASVGAMAADVVTAAAIAAGAIDAATFAAGAIDNAAFNVTETLTANPAAGGITAASFAAGAIDNAAFNVTETLTANPAAGGIVAASFGAGAIDAAAIAANAIGASELAADAVAEIADGVWDEARSGHATLGTYGDSYIGLVTGSAVAGTLSTTQMTTDLTEATNDHYNGRLLVFTSGALFGQATDITDYAGANFMLTFTALTEAPAVSDDFVIY